MSAYVVEDDCINAVVTWLYSGQEKAWEISRIEEALSQQGTIGDTFPEKLGNAMFALNCDAVDQRYGEGQAKEFRELNYAHGQKFLGSNYAVYDRLGEFLYQCSEGDVPESSKLFHALQSIYDNMAHTYFRGLRESKQERENDERRELRERIDQLERRIAGTNGKNGGAR